MTQKERIKYADEIERIKGLSLERFFKMSSSTIGRLTFDFFEPLVRLIFAKTSDLDKQRDLLSRMEAAYEEYGIHVDIPNYKIPEIYFSDFRFEIECDRLITLDGSKPAPKHASLTITPVSGSIPSTQDDKDKLIAALRAELEQVKQQVKELQDNKLDGISQEELDAIFPLDDIRPTKGDSQFEVRIKELEKENESLKQQIEEHQGEEPLSNEELLAEIESLKNDLQAFNTQNKKGKKSPLLSVKQMAIFLKAILLSHNSLTNNVRSLAPLLQKFGGWTEDTASNALVSKVTREECDILAKSFSYYAPKVASIIDSFPQDWEQEKRRRLNDNLSGNK